MPCRSDYMEPHSWEAEGQRVCKHLVYIGKMTGTEPPAWVAKGAISMYGPNNGPGCNGDQQMVNKATELLCAICRKMMEHHDLIMRIMYDGQSAKARALANWWDRHRVWDKKDGRS